MNRGFFAWICIIIGLLLSFVWLLSGLSVISSVPDWLPPLSVFALALGVIAGWFWAPTGIRR